jgi:hypothetical protein
MTAAYAPAFNTCYEGSLYGKWPAGPVFMSVFIPLMDKNGEVDTVPEQLAHKTGWPLELLMQGIEMLMQPDPRSRSKAHEGRRLVPIDPDRPWGWRVVNAAAYREKARLLAKSAREVESGSNKGRMTGRDRPEEPAPVTAEPQPPPPVTAGDRRPPPVTAGDRLLNSYSDSDTVSDSVVTRAHAHEERGGGDGIQWQHQPHPPPGPVDLTRRPTPEGQMAMALRDAGVQVTSDSPALVAWVRDGLTLERVQEAVAIARQQKPVPELIHGNYVDTILRAKQRGPPPKRVTTFERLTSNLEKEDQGFG